MQRSLKSFLVVATAAALVLSPATASLAQSDAPARAADRAVTAPAPTASAVAAAAKPSPTKFAKKVNRYAKRKAGAGTQALTWQLPVKTSKKRDWWVRVESGKGYQLGNRAMGMTASQAAVTRYRKAVVNAFTRYGLKPTGTIRGYGGSVIKAYASSRYACTVQYVTRSSTYSNGAAFWCTTKAKANSAVKKAAPFRDAYRKTASTRALAFDAPKIKASASSSYRDYRKASVGVGAVLEGGGFAGMFAKAPGQSWQFLLGTQSEVPCIDWEKTSTGSRAWAGEQCWRGDYATGYEDTVHPW